MYSTESKKQVLF